ncbi:MAG: hypothetical protein KIT25_14290 [Enhydrobacter sp.]|nr:MAG: hypothetical protein KIT25_14290 [Enhydrobacter sp.]
MANELIRGVYELGHVLFVLDGATHGFARADIAGVECFWTFGDMDRSHAGFVLTLRDGRRALVDFVHWHAFEQDEDFRVDVAFLGDGEQPPAPGQELKLPVAWSVETSHLARVLGR